MKITKLHLFLFLAAIITACTPKEADSDHLVILHTNDTHSQIDPDRHDKGGIVRRRALIDSIRSVRDNVVLVDAGDAVQGSLYYTLFSGEVERKMMNDLGYDIQILGNHEFDKGLDVLAREWKQLNATRLSTNYDMTGTPLEGLFVPSVMKEFNGKKVAFIGINLNPEGIVSADNYKGVKYIDAVKAANAEATRLKTEGADMVIAITHIGYENDKDYDDLKLAAASKDIDVIIGGHSHTVVDPNDRSTPTWRVPNAAGDTISVLQTGSSGTYLGEIDIDLDTREVKAQLIPVDSRLDDRLDPNAEAIIKPYREKVEKMRNEVIGESPYEFGRKSPEMLNLLSDFVMMRGEEICGKPVDLSIMNKGGIRTDLAKGKITKGEIIDIAPFDNSVVVLEIKGKDLLDNFKVMASQDGNGVSKNVHVLYDPNTREINSAEINGTPVDPDKTYRLATIDYLAAGNDYMSPLTRGVELAKSKEVLYTTLIDYISQGKLNALLDNPDKTNRMTFM